jgi:hypothetical protein
MFSSLLEAKTLFSLACSRVGLLSSKNRQVFLGFDIPKSLGDFVQIDLSQFSRNDLVVRYKSTSFFNLNFERYFERFDFLNEWNNMGYGRIEIDPDNPFGLVGVLFKQTKSVFAEVWSLSENKKISDFAAFQVCEGQADLWFARNCGPIDGWDWSVVEDFYSKSFLQVGGALPVVSEIPFGFKGAVTMRIDCDESISSGFSLFELYKSFDFPFSMAIKTEQEISRESQKFIQNVLQSGGSVVGHSHTHAPNWGGSFRACLNEVENYRKSLRLLNISGINYDYVVSPFHQNPQYAVEALEKCEVQGFVGGIICNDPEFLLARAGKVLPHTNIITHSQQCMFHGDIYHGQNNSIDLFVKAFDQSFKTKTFFGFLDHPFSNYWYGWKSEEERLRAHSDFLTKLSSISGLWKSNLVDAMRFLKMKSTVRVENSHREGHFFVKLPYVQDFEGLPSVCVCYQNQEFPLSLGDEIEIN